MITCEESLSEYYQLRVESQQAKTMIRSARAHFAALEATCNGEQREGLIRRRIGLAAAFGDVFQHFGNEEERANAQECLRIAHALFRTRFFKQKVQLSAPNRALYWFGYRLDDRTAPGLVLRDLQRPLKAGRRTTPPLQEYIFWGLFLLYRAEAHWLSGNLSDAATDAQYGDLMFDAANLIYHRPRAVVSPGKSSAVRSRMGAACPTTRKK